VERIMSKLIAISDGHEMTTMGKRSPPIVELDGRLIKENEFNKAVALILEQELKRCGFRTLNVSSTVNDTLEDRVKRANNAKADIFVAIHYNAYDGKFNNHDPEGIEIHIYPKSKEGHRLAECVLNELIKGTPQKNRGIKESNFYVLRETSMPAILTENGFMDNKREALLMIDNDFRQEVAEEHARGICKYFGVEYKEPPKQGKLYKVQVGAYRNKSNAEAMLEKIQKAGFDGFIKLE
jgi:N-acetylmuramoyl-L-alanine amidase